MSFGDLYIRSRDWAIRSYATDRKTRRKMGRRNQAIFDKSTAWNEKLATNDKKQDIWKHLLGSAIFSLENNGRTTMMIGIKVLEKLQGN